MADDAWRAIADRQLSRVSRPWTQERDGEELKLSHPAGPADPVGTTAHVEAVADLQSGMFLIYPTI